MEEGPAFSRGWPVRPNGDAAPPTSNNPHLRAFFLTACPDNSTANQLPPPSSQCCHCITQYGGRCVGWTRIIWLTSALHISDRHQPQLLPSKLCFWASQRNLVDKGCWMKWVYGLIQQPVSSHFTMSCVYWYTSLKCSKPVALGYTVLCVLGP